MVPNITSVAAQNRFWNVYKTAHRGTDLAINISATTKPSAWQHRLTGSPRCSARSRVREGIKCRRDKRVQAVCQHAAFRAFHAWTGNRLFGNVRGRRDIANGFQRSDQRPASAAAAPFNAKTVIERRWHHNQFLCHRFVAFWQHAHKPRQRISAAIAITSEATRKVGYVDG